MWHRDNWTRKLNDPRGRVNIIKRINRRMPWLKVVLAIVLIPTVIVLAMAWRIWLNSPNAKPGPKEAPVEISENEVELRSYLPAMEKEDREIVDRTEIKVLRGRVREIPAGRPLVALTFDDGPSSVTTPRLLDVLKEKNAVATFFMLGRMARGNPEIVKRAASEGHEIASHTMHHQNLPRIGEARVQADVNEANQVFQSILGTAPTLTRPPYGNHNAMVARIINTPLINWTVDTNDWRTENKNNSWNIFNNAVDNAFDGAIILMHDIYPTTVDRVGSIVDELRERGYELVTITEMATARGITMQPGVEYRSFRP